MAVLWMAQIATRTMGCLGLGCRVFIESGGIGAVVMTDGDPSVLEDILTTMASMTEVPLSLVLSGAHLDAPAADHGGCKP